MKILFTIAGLHPESGGPSRSVPQLCSGLAALGVDVEIVSHHYGAHLDAPLEPYGVKVTYVPCDSALERKLQWTPKFKKTLAARCGSVQGPLSLVRSPSPASSPLTPATSHLTLIHDTGIWLSTNHAAARVSREFGLPRIVSPRGMLTRWSLQHKGWKKRIAWRLFQHRDLQTAHLLHATSAAEAQDFRDLGFTRPIAIVPNGVDLPPQTSDLRPQASVVRTILFLSRIHPKKGLLNLVKAWAAIQSLKPKTQTQEPRPARLEPRRAWRVVIAGTDEMGHTEEIKAEIARQAAIFHLPSSIFADTFVFTGPVEGEAKERLYGSADFFVLPSHSENFGIVVAEALAFGIPVITTRGTPWEELVTHRCGWWVDIGVESLVHALREAMELPEDGLREMGERGRRLVAEKYSWSGAAAQMRSVYEWILGSGPIPDCVMENGR